MKKLTKDKISLGINIGAFKTLYSTFREINNIFLTNVLLMNESSRIIPSIICLILKKKLSLL